MVKKKLTSVFDNTSTQSTIENKSKDAEKINPEDFKTINWNGETIKIYNDYRNIASNEEILKDNKQAKPVYHLGTQNISILKHGLNLENYRIVPSPNGNGKFAILFKNSSQEVWKMLSEHLDEKTSRLQLNNLIQFLKTLSIDSEGFHLIEHVLLRPSLNENVFGFRFHANNEAVLVENEDWANFNRREEIIDHLLQLTHENLHKPADDTLKDFKIKTRQLNKQNSNSTVNTIFDAKSPNVDSGYLLDQLSLFKQNQTLFFPKFTMLVKRSDGIKIQEGFFNMRITVVLPRWPARFQDPEFKSYVESLFRISAPAHLRFNFIWLGIGKMRAFEDLYFQWIQSLKINDGESELSEKLASFIGIESFVFHD